jgi:hypothetical protein
MISCLKTRSRVWRLGKDVLFGLNSLRARNLNQHNRHIFYKIRHFFRLGRKKLTQLIQPDVLSQIL